MNVHKNARLTQGRALLVHRIRTDGWQMRPPPLVSLFDKRFVGWHGIGRAANLPCRTGVRRLPDAAALTPAPWPRSSACVVLRRLGLGRLSGLVSIATQPALSVGPAYGMIVLSDHPQAARFALFVMSEAGQAILQRHGFDPVGLAEP